MSHSILRHLCHRQHLRERLEAAFPDADEETLRDTLEGMTSLTDSLAELLRSSQEDQPELGGVASALLTIRRRKWVRFVIFASRGDEPGIEGNAIITSYLFI